jgi:APA family basic amino acid/polyamine antiporter
MQIKPSLTKTDLTMIVVSLVIGIGIFRTPATVAQQSGSEFVFFAAWIIGGIISICGALTFAEIGARYPVAGGFYKIFSACYHPAFAFMLNWSLVIINSFSAVGVAMVGAEYIVPVILPPHMQSVFYTKMVALTVILFLFILNYIGIKTGAKTQNLLSGIKIVMILGFSSIVFFNVDGATSATMPSQSFGTQNNSLLAALGVSLISVFFTYGGYQNTINFGADVKNPQKNIPASILTGMLIVIALYLLINMAYVQVLGFQKVQQSKLLASELASVIFGQKGFVITSFAIFISVTGYINTALLYNPRIYFAMAQDGLLPAAFKKVNDKTQVQEFALCFFTGIMLIALFWLGTFEKIVNYVMFLDSFALATAAATIFIFRQRMKGLDYTGFKIKLYPVLPVVFVTMLFTVTINVFVADVKAALGGLCIFAGGFPIYYLLMKINRVR